MKKSVIIVNGKGGAGKDTLCELAAKYFKTKNISSITPIKEIARNYGWSGDKDPKSRKFLSDLKKAFIEYNDLPTKYLYDQYNIFLNSENVILFVHIREPEEIDKFKELVIINCFTILIEREQEKFNNWGNSSDDTVNEYQYDLYYHNDKPLNIVENEFIALLKKILSEQ